MEKVIYWLKKLGVLRSASYKVKGDASKLNEMNATDGGMIQSQEKIDKEYAEKTGEKISSKSEVKKNSVLFWVFLLVAIFFLLAFFGGGFSFGSFLVLVFWFTFLLYLKKGSASWTTSFVKVLIIGLVLIVLSLVNVNSPDEKSKIASEENGSISKETEKENPSDEKCDDSNSSYASFNKIEKVIVSINPCEVPWILAQPTEKYELETKKGTKLKATVFNNYVNNVKAGESYTIRVLDIEEDITGQKDTKAGIAIVRWVPNKKSLESAKKEVAEIVEEMKY
jgi:hypothetical protein